MEGLIIVLGGLVFVQETLLLWMAKTKAGQKWVKNL